MCLLSMDIKVPNNIGSAVIEFTGNVVIICINNYEIQASPTSPLAIGGRGSENNPWKTSVPPRLLRIKRLPRGQ